MKALEYILSQPLLCTPEAAAVAAQIAERIPLAVDARKPQPVDDAEAGMYRRGPVAVIPVTGPIYRYASFFTEMCGGATVETIARDLRAALDDRSVRCILLSLDSPGGEAAGINELAGMIRSANDTKPVKAYVGNQAASAAYWLASAAGEIVCSDTAMLGSIGVVMGWTAREPRAGEKRYEFVSSQSPNKRPDPDTEKGKASIQQMVDDLADVFVATVARYRGVTADDVIERFGAGGILIGQKAVDAGMADRVGTFEATLEDMSRSAYERTQGLTASAVETGETSMFKFLFQQKADGTVTVEPVTADAKQVIEASAARLETQSIDLASDPTVKALQSEVAELRAAKQRAEEERIEALATAFVQAQFSAGRLLPADTAALKAQFIQAAKDDTASPLATGSRVQSLRDREEARPKHSLFREQVSNDALPAELRVIGAQMAPQSPGVIDPNAKPSEEHVNAMLATFPAGRRLLAQQKAKSA